MVPKIVYVACCLSLLAILEAQPFGGKGKEKDSSGGNENTNLNNIAQSINVNNITSIPGGFPNIMPGGTSISGMSGHGSDQDAMHQMDPCTWKIMANMAQAMSSNMQQQQSGSTPGLESIPGLGGGSSCGSCKKN